MNLIVLTLLLIVGITLLVVIALSVYDQIIPTGVEKLSPAYGRLDDQPTVGTIQQISPFITGGEASLSIFLYLNPTNRTPSAGSDLTRSIDNTNLTSGFTSQYPINLFNIGNNLNFKQFPGGANGSDQAQLEIVTAKLQTPTALVQLETRTEKFQIPPLPKQKWIYVTITRRARRYTVYYNGEAVASFRTQYYPVITSTVSLQVGDKASKGFFAFASTSQKELTSKEIMQELDNLADSRNTPILPKPGLTAIFSIFGGCPNGIFCFTPTEVPTLGTSAWTSPFA